MHSETYSNSDSLYSYNNKYVPLTRENDNELIFEQTCILLSFIGPTLLVIYFALSSHIFLHFNLIYDSTSLETFTFLYSSKLMNLAKLLFASSVFSGIGVLLSGIHENIVLFAFSLFCFLLSIGFYLPTLIMYLGD
jgi:hypothetical protein